MKPVCKGWNIFVHLYNKKVLKIWWTRCGIREFGVGYLWGLSNILNSYCFRTAINCLFCSTVRRQWSNVRDFLGCERTKNSNFTRNTQFTAVSVTRSIKAKCVKYCPKCVQTCVQFQWGWLNFQGNIHKSALNIFAPNVYIVHIVYKSGHADNYKRQAYRPL